MITLSNYTDSLKDFIVPSALKDSVASFEKSITHLPSWSIPG